MECIANERSALKGSFMKEMQMSLNLNHHAVLDEFPNAVTTTPAAAAGSLTAEEFSVDDLLDFSKINAGEDEEELEPAFIVDQEKEANFNSKPCMAATVTKEEEKSEFNVPPEDDVADLEWLSHFVEDSFTDYTLTVPALSPPVTAEASQNPTKATRSKRARAGGVVGWSVSCSETSSLSSTSSSASSSSPWLIYNNPSHHFEALLDSSSNHSPPHTTAMKKPKIRPQVEPQECGGRSVGGSSQPRRCSHCGVHKTPQWRAGPLGAKTLCNACGVRYKSGRLFPEYRPACSPTFSSEIHHNHHRKVLEMRNKKEVKVSESGRFPVVPSY